MEDIELPDMEIGRWALRTFTINGYHLWPVAINEDCWADGTCVARCLRVYGYGTYYKDHSSPSLDCHCGIYGTLSLQHLLRQYHSLGEKLICVIAAEGSTVIGDRGLRTAAARVVAYWSPSKAIREIVSRQFTGAASYKKLSEMLDKFEIPVLMEPARELPRRRRWFFKETPMSLIRRALGYPTSKGNWFL